MNKTFLTVVLLLCSSNGVFAAQAALTQIPALGSSASIKDLRDATNTRFAAAQSNFGEIYTALNGSPWLAQTTAPNIHNVFWVDTSGTSPAIKYWDGDSWEVAASGVDGTYTLPTASTEAKGGVKIGARLTMTGEILSADVQTTDISGKQDILVSGTNIKTVNGTSVLGSGNLVVGDGGGIAHATSDGNYYASRNGGWENLAGAFVATETDPVFLAWDKDYSDLINTPAIPAALADLGDDATHRIVTDAEKSAWNAKLGALPTWLPSTAPTNGRQILQAVGGCSVETYDTQATCEANAGTWTTPVYVNTSILSGLINDAGVATDDLWSAVKIISMLATKDNKQPNTLSLTEDITVTSSQLLDNKYVSNHGATGTVKIILPAVEYQITRTAIVESAFTFKICPPSGESLNVNGTDLTVDYCTISPVTVGSKTTVTRRRNGSGWIWDVDGVRGTWTTGL